MSNRRNWMIPEEWEDRQNENKNKKDQRQLLTGNRRQAPLTNNPSAQGDIPSELQGQMDAFRRQAADNVQALNQEAIKMLDSRSQQELLRGGSQQQQQRQVLREVPVRKAELLDSRIARKAQILDSRNVNKMKHEARELNADNLMAPVRIEKWKYIMEKLGDSPVRRTKMWESNQLPNVSVTNQFDLLLERGNPRFKQENSGFKLIID